MRIDLGDAPDPDVLTTGADIRYNFFVVDNGGKAFEMVDDGYDGTLVVDSNYYVFDGAGNFGKVNEIANITTLAALRTAWSTYDITTNDSNSRRLVREAWVVD